MYASYSYLGLIGHPRINAAAKAAVEQIWHRHERGADTGRFADPPYRTRRDHCGFQTYRGAITYTSGYVTNLTVISTLMGRRRLRHLRQAQPRLHCGRLPDVRRGVPSLQA